MQSTLIYGKHPVMEALQDGKVFEKIFLQQGIDKDFSLQIKKLAQQNHITLQVVPAAKLNRLTKGSHQGIAGFLSLVPYYLIEDILPQIYDRGETPLLLLLENITDVRNFGAIARTAEAAGVHALIIPQKGAAPINAEAMKTSAGALNKLMICRESNLMNAIKYLKLNGIQMVAMDAHGKQPIFGCDLKVPSVVILGAEGSGISPQVLRQVDVIAYIPIAGTRESYNVSVACGMVLYEIMRQRMEK